MPRTLIRPIDRLDAPPGGDAPARTANLRLAHAIPFQSLCAAHVLPFYGVVHIGYVRGEEPLNQTELIRVVEACSDGIQVQQRMTTRISLWVHHQFAPRGVGVLVEGGYACTPFRAGAALAGPTTTIAFHGPIPDDARWQREFLTRTRKAVRPEMVIPSDHD